MSTLTTPFTFTGGTYAVAAQVNSNFSTLFGWVNTNGVWTDGTRPFTATPSGPSADPVSGNQFTRKTYVDQRVINQGNPNNVNNNGIMKWGSGSYSFSGGSLNITFTTAFPTTCQSAVANVELNNPWVVQVVEKHPFLISLRCWNTETGAFFTGAAGVDWFAGGY